MKTDVQILVPYPHKAFLFLYLCTPCNKLTAYARLSQYTVFIVSKVKML
jgi:hypothetical protein